MAWPALLTVDEFLDLPTPKHAELVNGEIVMTNPDQRHEAIAALLITEIMLWIRAGAEAGEPRGKVWGGFGWRLDARNLRIPDVTYVAADRVPPDREAVTLDWGPTLAVEIRSNRTWRRDMIEKRAMYESHGALEMWLVDWKDETVRVARRSAPAQPVFDIELVLERGESLVTPLLPGLSVSLDRVFDA